MNNHKFKVGDIVRLVDGVKLAVITSINDSDYYPADNPLYRCKYINSTTRFRAFGDKLVKCNPTQEKMSQCRELLDELIIMVDEVSND